MTLEELKKHARPLVWEKDEKLELFTTNCISGYSCVALNKEQKWYSLAAGRLYETKAEAMQSIEEYHLRELVKFFNLEDENQ
jgi:lipoprotein|nr:MAG TPA: hypothetical protein [Caudoviricetes sp.]